MATEDGFLIWQEGNYSCRKCGAKGWLNEEDLEARVRQLEWVQRQEQCERERDRRAIEDLQRRTSALEQIAGMADVVERYHANLNTNGQAVDYWHDHYGVSYQSIARRKLGYCPSCPTASQSDSLTIPFFSGGKLYHIRHRLLRPNGTGKYRPELAGLPAMLYNTDSLCAASGGQALILEGEIKTIVLDQEVGLPAVGTMGANSFKPEWAGKFGKFGTVYVAYDPGAIDKAAEVAGMFKGRGRVVELPTKPDDFFVLYGGTASDFKAFLRTARPA